MATNRPGQILLIGQLSTNRLDMRCILGQSVAWGDASTTTGSGQDGETNTFVGCDAAGNRYFLNIQVKTDLTDIGGMVLQSAQLYLYNTSSVFDSGFPGASVEWWLYGARVAVDIDDCTWANRDATGPLAWANAAGGTLGGDLTSSPVGVLVYTSADHAATKNLSVKRAVAPVDILAEFQRWVDRQQASFVLQMRMGFAKPAGLGYLIRFDDPNDSDPLVVHSYVRVVATPELAPYADDGTAHPNLYAYLDPTVSDDDAMIQAGSPQPGGAGPIVLWHGVNTGANELYRCGLVTEGSVINTVRQSAASAHTLKHFHMPDAVASTWKPRTGTVKFTAKAADLTRYTGKFLPLYADPTTGWLTLETSAAAADALFSADTNWRVVGDTENLGTVLTRFWSATTATLGDEWTVKVSADQKPSTYLAAAEDRYFNTSAQGPSSYWDTTVGYNPGLPDTRYWGRLSNARMEQLWANSYVATVDGSPRTHIPIRYFANYTATAGGVASPILVSNDTGTVWHKSTIHSIISTGVNIDTLVLEDRLVDNAAADVVYGTTAYIDTGVPMWAGQTTPGAPLTNRPMGRLQAPDRARVAATPPFPTTSLTLTGPLRASGGQVHVYRDATGERETLTFTRSSNTLTFSTPTTLNHAAGDMVVVVTNDTYSVVFSQLRPESGADPVEQRAIGRLMRQEILA